MMVLMKRKRRCPNPRTFFPRPLARGSKWDGNTNKKKNRGLDKDGRCWEDYDPSFLLRLEWEELKRSELGELSNRQREKERGHPC